MNLVVLLGKVLTEPTLESAPQGRRVCRFRLSTSNGKNRQPDYHFIVLWGRDNTDIHPENVARLLRRGSTVQITGRIHESRWRSKETQEPRSRTEIIINNIQFINLAPREQTTEESNGNALSE